MPAGDFRWNTFNLDKVAKHGVSPAEAEHVVRFAKRPYPRPHKKGTWLVRGRGRSNRLLPFLFGNRFQCGLQPFSDEPPDCRRV